MVIMRNENCPNCRARDSRISRLEEKCRLYSDELQKIGKIDLLGHVIKNGDEMPVLPLAVSQRVKAEIESQSDEIARNRKRIAELERDVKRYRPAHDHFMARGFCEDQLTC